MSENAEIVNQELESVIDDVMGGKEETLDHSPDVVEEETPETFDDNAVSAPSEKDDSAEKSSSEIAALQVEIQNLNKRLHDTQSAMHKATEARANAEKELAALKNKQEDEDDWFSAEDEEKSKQLTADLQESQAEIDRLENDQKDIEQKAAEAIWDAAVAKVKADHPDFEEVVYGKLAPMLDESNPSPDAKKVRELYYALPDKSPASAYKFAVELEDRLLMNEDPEAYRKKIRSEVEREVLEENKNIEGKEGLDLLNSADSVSDVSTMPGDILDFLPK